MFPQGTPSFRRRRAYASAVFLLRKRSVMHHRPARATRV